MLRCEAGSVNVLVLLLVTGIFIAVAEILNIKYVLLYIFNWDWVAEQKIYLSFVPILTYLNADTEKLSIIKDNKGKSGVYKWTNLENGSCYVGSSVNLSIRLAQYYNLNFLTKFRKNSLIHKALLKYGYSNFKLEILEYCGREDAIKREQYFIDTFKPEYNILKVAGSALGHKHSAETIEKLRLKATGRKHTTETLAKMKGRTHSEATKNKIKDILRAEEVRKKMADAFLERTGVKVSHETWAKMQSAQANRDWVTVAGIKVEVKDLSTNLVIVYDSINKAAEALHIPKGTIARRVKLNIEKPYKKRYIIKAA